MVLFEYMASISNVLPASEARNNFYTMLDEVNTKLKTFTITLRGKVKAILISPDELESWRETLEIMADEKLVKDIRKSQSEVWRETLEIMADEKLVKDIRKSQSEVKRGKFITEEKLLKELGINPKDLD